VENHRKILSMRTILLAAAGITTTTFCSCGFGPYSRDFKESKAKLPRPPVNAEGPWQGTWQSKVNGHHGPLWCMVKTTPERPGHYDFRYRAGWGKFQFGDYTHTIPAKLQQNGSLDLEGSMVLPGGFGTYEVNGTLTRESFTATYRSAADHGTMTLQRPPEMEQPSP
jgi:hypothetical protein